MFLRLCSNSLAIDLSQFILQRLRVDLPSFQEAKDALFCQFNLYPFSFQQVQLIKRLQDIIFKYRFHDHPATQIILALQVCIFKPEATWKDAFDLVALPRSRARAGRGARGQGGWAGQLAWGRPRLPEAQLA